MTGTMATPTDNTAIDSLSSEQVSQLLRTLKMHDGRLEAAHQDAMRLIGGKRPCYILDYQLIHSLLYHEDETAEALLEFWYLLDQGEVPLFIGHGTVVEILNRLQLITGIDVPLLHRLGSYEDFLTAFSLLSDEVEGLLESLPHKSPEGERALRRLERVLKHRNMGYVWHLGKRLGLETREVLDVDAYHAARNVLGSIRKSRRHYYPNVADAMNFADVVGLRRQFETDAQAPLFPFLLTDTQPLLDEERWASDPNARTLGYKGQISRDPFTAIYSSLFLPPTPSEAEEVSIRTVDLSQEVSTLIAELRRSRAYRETVPEPRESWELLVSERRVTDPLAHQLYLLARLISDPTISEAQRIYDNAQLAAANLAAQQGDSHVTDSPRQLFDVILSISRVLAEPAGEIAELWHLVIERRVDKAAGWTTLSYFRLDEGPGGIPYLEVERHPNFTTFRWPTAAQLDKQLQVFSRALARHSINTADFYAGTETDVVRFDADLPVTSEELRVAMTAAETLRASELAEGAEPTLGEVRWIRMDSPAFDLYADAMPMTPGADAIIGVSGKNLDLNHLSELYQLTSSRFLFGSWLQAVLFDATEAEWRHDALS